MTANIHIPTNLEIPSKGRVILECIECGEPISWPVAPERIKRGESPLSAPAPGTMRLMTDPSLASVFVTSLASARVDTEPRVKMPRTCPNGHFVARVRTEPHELPHQVEYPASRVVARTFEDRNG